MKIVIATDSFKGSATQQQIAQTIIGTISEIAPDVNVVAVPLADGGEGTLQTIAAVVPDARWHRCRVPYPIIAPRFADVNLEASYLTAGDTAYVELASATGLTQIASVERDIMHTSTLGTGVLIADALRHGFRQICLTLGGSATCDGGMGILNALGLQFLDKDGNLLSPVPANFMSINQVRADEFFEVASQAHYTLLCDVRNPLLGENGSASVFAPQKGATPEQVVELERGLNHMSGLFPNTVADTPGAGAAGGVAAAMMAFFDALISSGAAEMLRLSRFGEIIADADLIITGEGRIDGQTLMGKLPAQVLEMANKASVPCVAICGCVDYDAELPPFRAIIPVTPPFLPLEEAMRTETTLQNISNATRTIISNFFNLDS